MSQIDGFTRVTNVLYPLSGLKSIPEEILKKAAERGTAVHLICDAIIADVGVGNVDESLVGYVKSFEQWLPKNFLEKPERFFCDTYKITGEIDGMYAEGDDLVLFDIKTPAKESSTWNLQLSAYAYLAKKAGYPITKIEVVRLNKNGNAAEVIRYEENFGLFESCLEVYRYFHDEKEQEDYLDYL